MGYQDRLMTGYIKKTFLYAKLKDALRVAESTPVVEGENMAYHLGIQFGMVDTLKKVIDELEQMPQDDPNEVKRYPRILGRPETWPPDA